MESDWTVTCGADDPVVVLPWENADRSLCFIDLRANPKQIDRIPEALRYPAIAAALRRWNRPDAPIFTAKCDVWSYPANLFDANDLPGFNFAHASYIDLLPLQPEVFSSFDRGEKLLRAWTQTSRDIKLAECRSEWMLRPARIFGEASKTIAVRSGKQPIDGFAVTVYVWGYGASPEAAQETWSRALSALSDLVDAGAPT